jgi:hypothetical protein
VLARPNGQLGMAGPGRGRGAVRGLAQSPRASSTRRPAADFHGQNDGSERVAPDNMHEAGGLPGWPGGFVAGLDGGEGAPMAGGGTG